VSPSEPRIVQLAGAILDGTSVDWASEVSSADLTERLLLDQLKLVAAVADVHRRLPAFSISTGDEPARIADVPPQQWGHLRVLEPIGRGAFGDVYRAWDTRLDREVALKLLPAGAASSDRRATSIIEEGRLLARVRHPNVVTIYGAEQIESRIGLWMELVKGRTLQQILDEGQSFTPAEVVRIGIELSRAVEAVHAAGLLHRDIKPHNVMVEDAGRVVLMDFGTGREVDDDSAAGLAGTPLYLAPELLSGSDPSVRSDVYSLGVLFYQLLTRSHPVRARSLHDLRLAHSQHERSDLRSIRPDVSPRLARIIDRALNPRPEDRFESAGSLVHDLIRQKDHSRRLPLAYGLGVAAVLVVLVSIASRSGVMRDVGSDRVAATDSAATTTPTRRSIAVLPFKAVAGGEADEGLRIGMTEAVIAHLNRIGTLRVEPLARVRAHSVGNRTVLEAGRALGVDTVVQGYVQQTDNRLQARLELLRTADGAVLSGSNSMESYPNVLEAQRHVVQSLAVALALTPAERARIVRQDTASPEAFQHYSFGLYHLEVFNLERMREAEREFREAIKLDPRYARPHAALALTLLNTVWLGGQRGGEVRESARGWALKAIELDESVALAHTVLGHIYQYFDYAPFEAQRAHLRAMALDDQDVSVLRAYSFFLLHHNAIGEALDVHRRTLELYPASPLSTKITAEMFYVARRYDECVAECRKAMTLEPNDANLMLSLWLGRCLEQQGKQREAVNAYEDGRAARGEPELAERLRRAYARGGWEDYWRERVRIQPQDPGVGAAAVYARLANVDEAIRALERAEATRSLGGFANSPDFDPLRSDPRFQALLARIGLSDEINTQLAAARAAVR
jgi:eukaryotic-like serine/threonine-protein kinase